MSCDRNTALNTSKSAPCLTQGSVSGHHPPNVRQRSDGSESNQSLLGQDRCAQRSRGPQAVTPVHYRPKSLNRLGFHSAGSFFGIGLSAYHHARLPSQGTLLNRLSLLRED